MIDEYWEKLPILFLCVLSIEDTEALILESHTPKTILTSMAIITVEEVRTGIHTGVTAEDTVSPTHGERVEAKLPGIRSSTEIAIDGVIQTLHRG